MKTSKDPRHIERTKMMQELFSLEFGKNLRPTREISASSQVVVENIEKIDQLIQAAASAWPIEKINRIDLAVLRLAVYELFLVKKTPVKVIVDEAVELAKEYGSDSSGGFVNGVLGTLIDTRASELH